MNFTKPKSLYYSIIALFILNIPSYAYAQSFSNLIFIGDSNTDNGRYSYIPQYTTGINAGVLATTGIFTTPGGLMWSAYLGSFYGVNVNPTSALGGGNNYAAGNAHVAYAGNNVIGQNAWSGQQQVSSYLNSTNNVADPNTLYTVYIGTNDLKIPASGLSGTSNKVNPQNLSALSALAGNTVGLVQSLSNAGAHYLLVPNIASIPTPQAAAIAAGMGSLWSQTWANSLTYYNQTVWNGIAAQGINFIPADFVSASSYVLLHPTQFGITNTNIATPACGAVYSFNCTSSNLVSPNAMNTHFFADTIGHVSSAVQLLQANYVYGLLTAPGQVSMLANQASISQIAINNAYLDQVGLYFRATAPQTLNAWALGDVQKVNLTNSQTSSTSRPSSGTLGIDYQYDENILLGAFAGYGKTKVNYDVTGNFTQSGTTLGVIAGFKYDAIWVNGILGYNWLSNNVNRITPMGITSFSNNSGVDGSNKFIALQTGYNFEDSILNHGPLIGYSYVNTNINGFTESGNVSSLQFSNQKINSKVGSAGYQAQAKIGNWSPYAKIIYNSHLGNIDRIITTSLTSTSAPSYSMPAEGYGRNWTNLTLGIGYQIEPKTLLRASFTEQFSQHGVNASSLAVNLNCFF